MSFEQGVGSLELKDERRTSNTQHRTSNKKVKTNVEHLVYVFDFRFETFKIGRWTFDVGRSFLYGIMVMKNAYI